MNISSGQKACEIYQIALEATEILYKASLFRSNQESELVETNDLFRLAAYAHAKNSDFEAAATIIERGRARGLSDVLERDSAKVENLQASYPSVYERYKEASEALYQLEIEERSTTDLTLDQLDDLSQRNLRQQASTIRKQFKDAIDLVRCQNGFEDFFYSNYMERYL